MNNFPRINGKSVVNIMEETSDRKNELVRFYRAVMKAGNNGHGDVFNALGLEIPVMAYVLYGEDRNNSNPSKEEVMRWWGTIRMNDRLRMILVILMDKGMMPSFSEKEAEEKRQKRFLEEIKQIIKNERSEMFSVIESGLNNVLEPLENSIGGIEESLSGLNSDVVQEVKALREAIDNVNRSIKQLSFEIPQ